MSEGRQVRSKLQFIYFGMLQQGTEKRLAILYARKAPYLIPPGKQTILLVNKHLVGPHYLPDTRLDAVNMDINKKSALHS